MIVFDLVCAPGAHVFEAWFASSDAYAEQKGRGLVSCPLCGSAEVDKAAMAPRVAPRTGNGAPAAARDPAAAKAMLAMLAAAQKKALAASEHVGARFADEARAIHDGDAPARTIHGLASPAQARDLRDDGIAVTPLPFPVPAPGEEN